MYNYIGTENNFLLINYLTIYFILQNYLLSLKLREVYNELR